MLRNVYEKESQSLTETITHGSPTKTFFTTEMNAGNSSGRFEDSRCNENRGARNSNTKDKLTYEDIFYRPLTPNGQRELVHEPSQTTVFSGGRLGQAADINIVQYLGIAADEPERIKRHTKPGFAMPLVEAGWTEAYCRAWCEEHGMLSPIYTTATRGGCWFCHNQGVEQLRLLRRNYPEYWEILLRWDSDSPVSFHPDGHTVHDFDRRFAAEESGKINPNDRRFRWAMLDMPEQMRMI